MMKSTWLPAAGRYNQNRPHSSIGDMTPLEFADQVRVETQPLGEVSKTGLSSARADGNNARVWGGMHYPSTVAASDAVGEAIANYVMQNAMQQIH
jgi:hypothetical protein